MGSASTWVGIAWLMLPLSAIGFWAIVLGLGAAGSKGGGTAIVVWIASYLVLDSNNQLPDDKLWVVVPSMLTILPIVALRLASARVERPAATSEPKPAGRTGAKRPTRKKTRATVSRAVETDAVNIPAGQKLLAAGVNVPLLIDYIDQAGAETQRQIIVKNVMGIPREGQAGRVLGIQAYCLLRKEPRSFLRSGILTAADPETGEVIGELDRYLLERR